VKVHSWKIFGEDKQMQARKPIGNQFSAIDFTMFLSVSEALVVVPLAA
jgi:hypothetical protein